MNEATTTNKLAFGYNYGLVPGVQAAWGARWIVTQDGGVDQVFDRQDGFGDKDRFMALLDWLNGGAGKAARDNASRMLADRVISTRQSWPVVLYQDREGAVIGNTHGSAGYMYVAAYRYDDLPEGLESKGLELVLNRIYNHVERDGEPICGAADIDDDRPNDSTPSTMCPLCEYLANDQA
jgi:hypothetical protein